jgi:hypothetical protein
MKRRMLLGLALALAAGLPAAADEAMAPGGAQAESTFVQKVSADLNARFPTPEAARKAGYVRYTEEDDSGAISYANRHWTSTDPAHPSQLWYDVSGRLLGADYSVLQADSPSAPHLFGIQAQHFQKFGAHVHYGLFGPNGTVVYGAVRMAKLGDNATNPLPQDLVAAGVAKKLSDVRFVFLFPAIWDASVWVIPNSNGAFADKNPAVKPSNPKASSM